MEIEKEITIVDMPLEIENIIETYKNQLLFNDVVEELKEKVKHNIHFVGASAEGGNTSTITFPNGKEIIYELNRWEEDGMAEFELITLNATGDEYISFLGSFY